MYKLQLNNKDLKHLPPLKYTVKPVPHLDQSILTSSSQSVFVACENALRAAQCSYQRLTA